MPACQIPRFRPRVNQDVLGLCAAAEQDEAGKKGRADQMANF